MSRSLPTMVLGTQASRIWLRLTLISCVWSNRGNGIVAQCSLFGNRLLTVHRERITDDPRVEHRLTLEVDNSGNPLRIAEVAYARRPSPDRRAEQEHTLITYTQNQWASVLDKDDSYLDGVLVETGSEEITGVEPVDGWLLTPRGLDAAIGLSTPIGFATTASHVVPQRRRIHRARVRHWKEDLTALLPPNNLIDQKGLIAETATLALTSDLLRHLPGENRFDRACSSTAARGRLY